MFDNIGRNPPFSLIVAPIEGLDSGGMSVAHIPIIELLNLRLSKHFCKGDIKHVVDNSRDFTRSMATRLHRKRWWQPHPSVVGGGAHHPGYQPRVRPERPGGVDPIVR